MAKLIVLVGLPGCGKSSYAELYTEARKDQKWVIHSSDAMRKELFGDENDQSDNNRVFQALHKRVREDLKNGINVIYDATNVTRKSRRAVLNLAGKDDLVECHIVWAPVNVCVERDSKRDRTVGKNVIEKFIRR